METFAKGWTRAGKALKSVVMPVCTPGGWGVMKGSVRSLWNRLERGPREMWGFQVKAHGPLNMEVAFKMEIETHLGSKTKVCNMTGIKNYPRSSRIAWTTVPFIEPGMT